jgi:CRP-like cAMP-binding protein
MTNPLILKLEHGADLTDEDRDRLEEVARRTREVGPRQDLIREGDKPTNLHVILDGFACRYKVTPAGKRQIMAYFVPGDFCDLHVWILGQMDHSIATLSPCTIAEIPSETIEELTARYPRITRALWWATLVDEGTLREWLVSMGQRPADRQLANLVCELLVRLQTVGRASENSYELPVTQEELGDTLGLSTVHVNRTIHKLREDGLLTFEGQRLTIPDVDALKVFAGFSPNYLHRRSDRNESHRGV